MSESGGFEEDAPSARTQVDLLMLRTRRRKSSWLVFLTEGDLTKTTEFISELIRAANEIERLTPLEKRRLIERGLSTAMALRDLVRKTGRVAPINVAFDRAMVGIAEKVETLCDETAARSLLALADEIRRLRILNAS